MSTLVQDQCYRTHDALIARNAEVIVSACKKRLLAHVAQSDGLVTELAGTVALRFEKGWFDRRFSPYEIRNESMAAAEAEFGRWFEQAFGVRIAMQLKTYSDPDDAYYDGVFTAYISAHRSERRRIKRLRSRRLRKH